MSRGSAASLLPECGRVRVFLSFQGERAVRGSNPSSGLSGVGIGVGPVAVETVERAGGRGGERRGRALCI